MLVDFSREKKVNFSIDVKIYRLESRTPIFENKTNFYGDSTGNNKRERDSIIMSEIECGSLLYSLLILFVGLSVCIRASEMKTADTFGPWTW